MYDDPNFKPISIKDEINDKLSDDLKLIQKKYNVTYPIRYKTFARGPEKTDVIPYSPIYTVPDPSIKTYNWIIERQDDEHSLYNKINNLCNLYLAHRYILYIDCTTLQCLREKTLEKIIYTCYYECNETLNLESARCRNLADQIRSNTIEKYNKGNYAGGLIYSYTFKSYIPQFEWNYFSLSPFLSILYREVCKEIHKTFAFFYNIITFNLDTDRLPYIEVLITNRTKEGLCNNVYLSKDNETMDNTTFKLRLCMENGIRNGVQIVNEVINKHNGIYNYPPANDPEEFRKFASPTISDLNFGYNLSKE